MGSSISFLAALGAKAPAQGKSCPGGPRGTCHLLWGPLQLPLAVHPLHPHRFWASVEPYCADLTNEEVRVLEELLKPPEDEAEHYKVKNS